MDTEETKKACTCPEGECTCENEVEEVEEVVEGETPSEEEEA